MPIFNVPVATARQISGRDPAMNHILAVLVKRTYSLGDRACILADEQLPLSLDAQYDPDNPDLLIADADIFPFKPATDVVVRGNVHLPVRQRTASAAVGVGRVLNEVFVSGDRRSTLSSLGRVVFSEPESFDVMPLRYDRAYGGKDKAAEARQGNPIDPFKKYVPKQFNLEATSLFRYPRNPQGRGYLLQPKRDSVEQTLLPNLEDPSDRLTPDRILAGSFLEWPKMPLPRCFDWMNHLSFPRIAYSGIGPPVKDPQTMLEEVRRGWAPPGLLERKHFTEKFSFQFTNGASLGLQFPYLRGDEDCLLNNIHPRVQTFRFRLPDERPKIWTDGRNGKFHSTDPVIHTVLIEPDESRLSIVWRGSAPALRPYMPEELEKMPFRVEW